MEDDDDLRASTSELVRTPEHTNEHDTLKKKKKRRRKKKNILPDIEEEEKKKKLLPDIVEIPETTEDSVRVDLAEELEFSNKILQDFNTELTANGELRTLPDMWENFVTQLRDRETTVGKFVIDSYIVLKVLPIIVQNLLAWLQNSLPESCKLNPDNVTNLIASLAATIDPESYTGALEINNFSDMLDVTKHTDVMSHYLDEDIETWLRKMAQEHLKISQSEGVECTESAEQLQRWRDIAGGHFPFGYNSANSVRYQTIDYRFLLYPTGDPTVERKISKETAKYIIESAEQLLDELEPKSKKDSPLTDAENTLKYHLLPIAKNRTLPFGYTTE